MMKRTIAIMLLPLMVLMSCSDNENNDVKEPQPVMPPTSSMAPDLSNFQNDESSNSREELVSSWAYAAINVEVYSGILYSSLAVPVTAFKLAANQNPSFDTDANLWIWEYDAEIAAHGTYSVELTADVNGQDVEWTGYITKEGTFERFVWFEGESELDGTSGEWTLYESPENPSVWMTSVWTNNQEGSISSTFTIKKDGEYLNSYISYGIDAEAEMNRSMIISNTEASEMIFVEWNSEEGNGRVKSESYFEDNLYHCWDDTFNDTDC